MSRFSSHLFNPTKGIIASNSNIILSIFAALLTASWPFLSFINNNIDEPALDFSLVLWIVFELAFLIFLLSFTINLLFMMCDKKDCFLNISISTCLSVFILIFSGFVLEGSKFYWLDIRLIEISIIFLFISTFVVVFIFLKRKPVLINNLIIPFFVFANLAAALPLSYNFIQNLLASTDIQEVKNEIYPLGNKISESYNNIYYIILDAQSSLKTLEKYDGFNDTSISSSINKLENLSFIRLENSRSSYNTTHLTLRSIFDLSYQINENSAPYKNRKKSFPEMMQHEPLLLRLLNEYGYEFKWVGNGWGACKANKYITCLGDEKIIESAFTKEMVLEYLPSLKYYNEIRNKLVTLYEQIPIGDGSIVVPKHLSPSINRVVNHLKRNNNKLVKPTFVFIHEMLPHPPYRYTKRCSHREEYDVDYDNWSSTSVNLYLENSECALFSSVWLAEYLSKYDKDSIVVIQGDHGPGFSSKKYSNYVWSGRLKDVNLDVTGVKERMSILNLIKTPEYCKKYLRPNLDNVNTAIIAVACGLGFEPKTMPVKTYWGLYRDDLIDLGKVKLLN